MLKRLAVLGAIVVGAWLVFSSDDEKTISPSAETEKSANSEIPEEEKPQNDGVSDEELDELRAKIGEKIELDDAEDFVKIESKPSQKKVVAIPRKVAPAPKKVEKQVEKSITMKVFLYDFGIDFSQKTGIPAGEITFVVNNNGNFSHDFSIRGVEDFGKVRPGETRIFSAELVAGEFEVFSGRGQDENRGMNEVIEVVER